MSRWMNRNRTTRRAAAVAPLIAVIGCLALGGCATSGDISDVNARLDAIDRRLDDNAKRIDAAQATSADALARAEAAEVNVRAAEMRANDAAQKAAAAFERTVRK